jgi:hypothetical protein
MKAFKSYDTISRSRGWYTTKGYQTVAAKIGKATTSIILSFPSLTKEKAREKTF